MSKTGLLRFLLPALAALPALRLAAQHAHINAGVADAPAGSRLAFLNASRFAAESGYVVSLPFVTNGVRGGYYIANSPTFTALPSTLFNGGPTAGHADPGTRIVARVVSVEGPAGGAFGFWESPGDELDAEALTFSVPVGESSGRLEFPLSENDGQPGDDPYGHVHGRFYSATRAGLYTVGIVLRDSAQNGPGGGPLHADSQVTRFQFQAGVTIAGMAFGDGNTRITFATRTGATYRIESAERLGAEAVWTVVAGPVTGDDHLATVDFPTAPGTAFYRLRVE